MTAKARTRGRRWSWSTKSAGSGSASQQGDWGSIVAMAFLQLLHYRARAGARARKRPQADDAEGVSSVCCRCCRGRRPRRSEAEQGDGLIFVRGVGLSAP